MDRSIVTLDGYTLTPAQPYQAPPEGEPAWQPFEALGQLSVYPRTAPDEILERAGQASCVLTNKVPFDANLLQQLPRLEYIGVLATGVNVIDLDAARQHGVTVTNVPGYSGDSVAQHVFALLLELVHRVADHHHAIRQGEWFGRGDFSFTLSPITELAGKTLGIVGLGAIGQRVARIGHALGMNIAAAHQSSMNQVHLDGIEIDWHPLENLISLADVLTLHCPLTEATYHLMNADRLGAMKPSAILINTGRGPLIDEPALAQALQEGWIAGAGLDVLSQEPPPDDHPLLSAPRCLLTPHLAWATREARHRLMQLAAENLRAYLDGRPKNVVNPPASEAVS